MAQAILIRVIEEIKTLEPDELRKVQQIVQERLAPAADEDPDEQVLQAMLQAGLITEIKRPDRSRQYEYDLIPIQGEPLSETIIEERR